MSKLGSLAEAVSNMDGVPYYVDDNWEEHWQPDAETLIVGMMRHGFLAMGYGGKGCDVALTINGSEPLVISVAD